MEHLPGICLLVVLILFICMILRDTAKVFFADFLKVAIFVIVLVAAIAAWFPLRP